MSTNEHWLLVFMALGANLKISIFDPPSVGGTYKIIIIIIIIYYNNNHNDNGTRVVHNDNIYVIKFKLKEYSIDRQERQHLGLVCC